MPSFEKKTVIGCDPIALYAYHARPGAFERLVPPWQKVQTVAFDGALESGARRVMRIENGPVHLTWIAEHHALDQGLGFRDTQVKGPFSAWDHVHRFEPHDDGSILHDEVTYKPPLGPLGALLGVPRTLTRMFAFRHRRTKLDLERHARTAHLRPDRVLFAGETGPFSDSVAAFLSVGGIDVFRLEPGETMSGRTRMVMRPYFGGEACHPLDGADAVIHTGRGHVDAEADEETRFAHITYLCRAMGTLSQPPALLINLHGHRPSIDRYTRDPVLEPALSRKVADPDTEVRAAWRERLEDCFPRVIQLHFGDRIQGPFRNMVNLLLRLETFLFLADGAKSPTFRWISGEDAGGAILHLLCHDGIEGEIAAIAPEQATRADLQELLIKRGFSAYIMNRMLKVLPWARPGQPPGLDPGLEAMKSLTDVGFVCHAPTLARAIDAELGT